MQIRAACARVKTLQAELRDGCSPPHPGALLLPACREATSGGGYGEQTCWSAAQLQLVGEIVPALAAEYATRRRVLLKRLDVTLQTFLWGSRAAPHAAELRRRALQRRERMEHSAHYTLGDALAARSHLLEVSAVSTRRCSSALKRQVLDGGVAVPDRGGRVGDASAAKNASGDMPAFAPRTGAPAGQRRGSGGGGDGGRGRGRGRSRSRSRGGGRRSSTPASAFSLTSSSSSSVGVTTGQCGGKLVPQSRAREGSGEDGSGPRPQRKRRTSRFQRSSISHEQQ